MRRARLLSWGIAAALLAGGAIAGTTAVAAEERLEAKAQQPELISLRFYADWCGHCRTLDAKLDEVKAEFKDKPVLFTYFDITDNDKIKQAGYLAAQLGVGEAFEEYGNSTADMVLIDPKTGNVKDHITHEVSKDDLRQRIAAALDGEPGSEPK